MSSSKTTSPKSSQNTPAAAAIPARAEPVTPAPTGSDAPSRPGGKLGLIVQHLEAETGVTVDELAAATGWQRHTVHGALSRLRTRGFAMHLTTHGDRKAYRLVRGEG
jgi:hypothetical protein